jgi:hypothetical protein
VSVTLPAMMRTSFSGYSGERIRGTDKNLETEPEGWRIESADMAK